jgi:hypothetical protein
MSTMAQGVANAIPGVAGALPMAGAQIAASGPVSQHMGETKPINSAPQVSPTKSPTSLNVNHPTLAQWKPVFQKNAATAKDAGEIQKSQAVTDFVLSQRDPAYAEAKQKMADEPMAQNNQGPTKMADGGVIPDAESRIDEPQPALGSTLEGFANQLKNPTHETSPMQQGTLPTQTTQKFHEPFNSDMADKLKAFLEGKKERDDAQSR